MRIKDGEITNCGVVNGTYSDACHLSAADTKALLALPVDQRSATSTAPVEPDVEREPHLARRAITC